MVKRWDARNAVIAYAWDVTKTSSITGARKVLQLIRRQRDRFGTLYNFRIRCGCAAADRQCDSGVFKTGSP